MTTSRSPLARLLVALAALALFAATARAADDGGKKEKSDPPAPKAAITHHHATIGGKPIAYTATAATIDLRNDENEPTARMFYVAYTADGAGEASRRPVTFCFNGGPGSSTMWLHMGSFGPVRVVTTDAQPTPPPPYTVEENPESLLDLSDLVFVDAVGTGFSRILQKGEPKDFYGTDQDIAAFGQFIQRWLSASGRWNSPKFLFGESYGTTRAAGLLAWLQRRGVAFNGTVLVSSYLNAYDDFNGPDFSSDTAFELYLPTMAATAWYHDKVSPKPADLPAFLAEVRHFAVNEYAHALMQGSALPAAERDAVVTRLAHYTGMPEALIRNANLRIRPDRFQKELLRGERRTVGRLDARFEGIDHDAAGESPESDASSDAFEAAFVGAFNSYIRGDLGFQSGDELYRPTNYGEVNRDWDLRHNGPAGRSPMPDVAEDLREAMSANPHLRIFSANGYYDFATPFFETEYTLGHMGLDPAIEKNITFGYYEAGHMMYIHPPARKQLKADLQKFYAEALAR